MRKLDDVTTQQAVDEAQKQGEIQVAAAIKIQDKIVVSELIKKSNRILLSISTHALPFDLFPDTINIEEGRVTVITRNFVLSSRIRSVDIHDITNVFINTAPFFAQLVIVSKNFTENEIRVKNLRKDDAIYARRIIEGLRVFETNQIDTSAYTTSALILKLEELSKTDIVV